MNTKKCQPLFVVLTSYIKYFIKWEVGGDFFLYIYLKEEHAEESSATNLKANKHDCNQNQTKHNPIVLYCSSVRPHPASGVQPFRFFDTMMI